MCPRGSFYHHFESKEDFAEAALERYAMREGEHAAAVLGDATISPLKRLRRYLRRADEDLRPEGSNSRVHDGPLQPGNRGGESAVAVNRSAPRSTTRQQTIAAVIGEAVANKELGCGARIPSRWRAFCLTVGRERCCVRRQKKATLRCKPSCAIFLMDCWRRDPRARPDCWLSMRRRRWTLASIPASSPAVRRYGQVRVYR